MKCDEMWRKLHENEKGKTYNTKKEERKKEKKADIA